MKLLNEEEVKLWQRRQKLKILLSKEEEELRRELDTKEAMAECGYCKERECKLEKYEEDIEKEKERECLKALERERM